VQEVSAQDQRTQSVTECCLW